MKISRKGFHNFVEGFFEPRTFARLFLSALSSNPSYFIRAGNRHMEMVSGTHVPQGVESH